MSLADLVVMRPEFRIQRPSTDKIEEEIKRIEETFPSISSRHPINLNALVKKTLKALHTGRWAAITAGDVARLTYAYLTDEHQCPKQLEKFLDDEIQATTNSRLINAIANSYLETWKPGSAASRKLRDLLVIKSEFMPIRWQQLFRSCPELLSVKDGANLLGSRMTTLEEPYRWLKEAGLADPHGHGLMEWGHKAFLDQTDNPNTVPVLEKLLGWVSPGNGIRLDDIRSAGVVNNILRPWQKQVCQEPYKSHCLTMLIDQFGDPRRENPAFWALVDEKAKMVLNKWLAQKSMEAMFEVVTIAEKKSSSIDHWPARRRFWMGLYEKGLIDEAWLILGKEAETIARDLAHQTGDRSYLGFGRQDKRRDTCLLLMRFGKKIVLEGSHSFRIHFFPNSMRQTPQLYADRYDLEQIILPNPHPNAIVHNGDWMRRVRQRL